MLQITIPATKDEQWDERTEEFIYVPRRKEITLRFEHSLISIHKWESKWCVPFFTTELSDEQFIDYIRCMALQPNIPSEVYDRMTAAQLNEILEYLKSPMTATTFSDRKGPKGNKEIITAELVYYWMTALNIPFECAKWNIKQLLTLIRVCEIKNEPPKKRSTRDIMQRNTSLNAMRRKKFNTKG